MEELNETIELMEKQLIELKKLRARTKEEQDRYEEYNNRIDKIESDITQIKNAII